MASFSPVLLPSGVPLTHLQLFSVTPGTLKPQRGIFFQANITRNYAKAVAGRLMLPKGSKVYIYTAESALTVLYPAALLGDTDINWYAFEASDDATDVGAMCKLMIDAVLTYSSGQAAPEPAPSVAAPLVAPVAVPTAAAAGAALSKKAEGKRKAPPPPEKTLHDDDLFGSDSDEADEPLSKRRRSEQPPVAPPVAPPVVDEAIDIDTEVAELMGDDKYENLKHQLKSVLAEKQQEKDALQAELKAAQDELYDQQRKQEIYAKRKCAEVTREKRKREEVESKKGVELTTLQQRDAQIQQLQAQLKLSVQPLTASIDNKSVAMQIYGSILDSVNKQLQAAIDHMLPSTRYQDGFEYENFGSWHSMPVDDETESKLRKLIDGTEKEVSYHIAGRSYKAVLSGSFLDQINIDTGVKRRLRWGKRPTTEARKAGFRILFGHDSMIKLDPAVLKAQIIEVHKLDMTKAECVAHSDSAVYNKVLATMAELAQKWSELCSCHEYDAKACEVWIKPVMLLNFLSVMLARGVHYIRVVGHGSTDGGYNGMRLDVMGATLIHSGRNGQIKGHGHYFGLCDLAPTSFNNRSSEKTGTMILELWATESKIKQEEGHYTCWRYLDPSDLHELPVHEVCGTAVALRENNYVLPIGLVRAK